MSISLYNKNKYDYTYLKIHYQSDFSVDCNSNQDYFMKGGLAKKIKKRKNMFEEPFGLPENAKQIISLPTPVHIKKIGEFMINNQGAAIGDGYWRKIDLRPGIYKAYRIDDNLMIMHKDLNIKPNKSIKTWSWKNSGTGVDRR